MILLVGLLMVSLCAYADNPLETVNHSEDQFFQSIQADLKSERYQKEILPNNFSYLIQLLEYGKRSKQNRSYCTSVVKLFTNMLKGSEYVNPFVFASFVEQAPNLLKHHFEFNSSPLKDQKLTLFNMDSLDRIKQANTMMLYTNLTQKFSYFKQNPESFLDELNNRMIAVVEEEETMQALRAQLIKFMEVGLGKLIWGPEHHKRIWSSIESISRSIAQLSEHNILDDIADLDDLYWTLTHRMALNLELLSADLPYEFFNTIHHNLRASTSPLFEIEEQEAFLVSKKECLERTLRTCLAKKQARDHGMVVSTAA